MGWSEPEGRGEATREWRRRGGKKWRKKSKKEGREEGGQRKEGGWRRRREEGGGGRIEDGGEVKDRSTMHALVMHINDIPWS